MVIALCQNQDISADITSTHIMSRNIKLSNITIYLEQYSYWNRLEEKLQEILPLSLISEYLSLYCSINLSSYYLLDYTAVFNKWRACQQSTSDCENMKWIILYITILS